MEFLVYIRCMFNFNKKLENNSPKWFPFYTLNNNKWVSVAPHCLSAVLVDMKRYFFVAFIVICISFVTFIWVLLHVLNVHLNTLFCDLPIERIYQFFKKWVNNFFIYCSFYVFWIYIFYHIYVLWIFSRLWFIHF